MSVAYAEDLEHAEPRIYHNGPWTPEDVEALPEPLDGARYEILSEGVLTVSPSPGTPHQRASYKLGGLLRAAAPGDVEILETMYVPIPGGRFCEPDIVVVDAEYSDTDPVRLLPEKLRLVVEIVSPSTHAADRQIKPQLYAEAGIPVFWRLEIEKTPHLIAFELRRGRYVRVVTARAGESTTIPIPFPVTVDPADLVRRTRT